MDVKTIITEEIKRLFEQRTYRIPELVKLLERLGFDNENQKFLTTLLLRAYKQGGDKAVTDMYAEMAGVQIEPISNGRYVFANLYDPEKANHNQQVVYENEKS